jgi:sugar lactone lactonase YvrE/uncharacterized cupredoxin-like copper-binding protein
MNRRQFSIAASVTATSLAVAPRAGLAQDATPIQASTPPAPEVLVEVIATGLLDPRFVASDGTAIYFTEAGTGGETPVFSTAGAGTPEAESPVSHRGTTGKLSRLDPDGTITVVADGFQSYTFGGNGEIVGPAGIALDGAGKAYVTVGAPGPFVADIDLTGAENVLVEVDLASGEQRIVADLGQYEIANDPDPMAIDSNLYGVAVHEGTAYVADSGGNSVLAVEIATGEISTFAVPGGIDVPFLGDAGNPLRAGEAKIDSVPSGIAIGPDGRIYLTYVTGGPFPIGFARVDAFSADGQHEEFATGLTMVTDVAFSSDGTAYAVMMSSDFLNGGPGKIVRIAPDGAHVVVIDNLQLPNGLAFAADDTLYVTHKASFHPIGGGELLRMTGVTKATGVPLTGPADTATAEATPVANDAVEPEKVHVVFGDMYFDPTEISIPADTDVVFTFENKGFLQHDFFVGGADLFSGVLGGGQTGEMVANLPAGRYEFWCTQIGHRQAGMIGVLTVG